MAHQSLDHNEILNVRWATVDPNPAAQKREARRIEEQAAEAIRKALPASYVAEIEGRDPESRKRRRIEGHEVSESEQAKEVQRVGASDGRSMIEAGDGAKEEEESHGGLVFPQRHQNPTGGNGILSGSTLAALRGYEATTTARTATPTAGPLVGYGSDDSDDCDGRALPSWLDE